MSAYEKIKNPETGKYEYICGYLGKQVLANYLEVYQSGGVSELHSDTFVVKKIVSDEECRLASMAAKIGISPKVHSCDDSTIVLDNLNAIDDDEFTERENEIFNLILKGARELGAIHTDPGPAPPKGRNVMKDDRGELYLIDWGDVEYTGPKLHIYNTLVVWDKFWVGGLRGSRPKLRDTGWIVPYLKTIEFGLVSYNVYMTKTNIAITKRQIYDLNQGIRTLRTAIKMAASNEKYKTKLNELEEFIEELQLTLPNMEKAAETALAEFEKRHEEKRLPATLSP